MNPQIFGAGVQQRSRWVCAQRRVNAYLEIADAGAADKAQLTWYCRPGLVRHAFLGETPVRGLYSVGVDCYAAHRDKLYRIFNDGTQETLGTLDTAEGAVYFAHGHLNAAGDQYLALVDGVSGYTWNLIDSVFARIADGDFPAAPESLTYINGYPVVNRGGTGQFFIGGLDDFTAWDALDFSTASQGPDDLIRVFGYQGVLGLFGAATTEFWGFTGDAAFPFARLYGAVADWGLAARASLAPFGESSIGLARNALGECMVAIISAQGYAPVSPPDLVAEFNGYTLVSDAVGASFMLAGHMLYLLTFPSAGGAGTAKSWCYDRASGVWSEWRTGADGGTFAAMTAHAGDGALYLGGRADGTIYKFDAAAYDDDGAVLPWELTSRHIFSGGRMQVCTALQLDFETGVGDGGAGQGAAPEVMLAVSRDGGNSFGVERRAALGAQSTYQRVTFNRLGAADDLVFRLRVTDPVKRVLTGERLEITVGAA